MGEKDLGLLLDHDQPSSDPTLIRPLTGGSDPEIIILNHVSADSSQSIVQLGYFTLVFFEVEHNSRSRCFLISESFRAESSSKSRELIEVFTELVVDAFRPR